MSIKVNIWIMILVTVAMFAEIAVGAWIFSDNRRLSDNFAALAEGTEYDRINDSVSAARAERLLLDNAEIRSHFPYIEAAIEKLDVKLRQLEQYSVVNSAANYEIASRLRDTVTIMQTVIQDRTVHDTVQLQYIQYHDRWIDFQQAIVADSAYTDIRTRDSIAIVQSWERPHRFWFLRWGRKRHVQTVTNANPHATITSSIYIEKQ